MENYIVRIYRRAGNDPESIAGIVEKPDSGENIPFHSNEDFIKIFFGVEPAVKENNKQQAIEQRRFRRFNVKDSTLIFDKTTDVGEIIDISLGGLSFYCPNMPEDSQKSFKVGILCQGVEDFCTGKINCRNLMVRYSPGNSFLSRSHEPRKIFSIEFDKLDAKQRMQLLHIIQHYGVSGV